MIPREELPEDASDWTGVSVSFPQLPDNSPVSPPCSEDRLFEYVRKESADVERADRARLKFIRTALVSEAKYWLWEYTEEDGELVYVICRVDLEGSNLIGLSTPNGLSHEQYMLADYYDEVYWS